MNREREAEAVRLLDCPACGSQRVRESRSKNLLEALARTFLFIHPVRCRECLHRFWRWKFGERL